MPRYRKILVAYDGSPSSDNALRQAFRLADDEKSWITVLTVVPAYEGDLNLIGIKDVHEQLRRPGEKILARASALAEQEKYGIKPILEEGVPDEKIIQTADSYECCGLIVMGRKGTSGIEKMLVGNTTARVIGSSTKDVLIVPEHGSIGWRKILIATDGSPYSTHAARKAIELAEAYGSEVIIISVVDVPAEFYGEAPDVVDKLIDDAKKYAGELKDLALKAGLSASAVVLEGDSHTAITETAEKEDIHLIVMGSHGRTGIKKLLMGSVTAKVIGYAPCPVLIVKP